MLLDLFSISSLNALETVSFTSLFLDPSFPFISFDGNSPFSLLVALCSASLRFSKSFVIVEDGFEKIAGLGSPKTLLVGLLLLFAGLLPYVLVNGPLFGYLLVFFSMTTEFLLCVLANSIFSIDFFAITESVSIVFFFFIFF